MMPRQSFRSVLAFLVVVIFTSSRLSAATIHVAPNGQDTNAATQDAPLATLEQAAGRAAPGDVIRLASGTYHIKPTIKLGRSGEENRPIRIEPADEHQRPVLDFAEQQFGGGNNGINVTGDWWQIVGLEIIKAGHNGILVSGSHNLIEKCVVHECQDSGINLSTPASNN